jgi:hypothetical protein
VEEGLDTALASSVDDDSVGEFSVDCEHGFHFLAKGFVLDQVFALSDLSSLLLDFLQFGEQGIPGGGVGFDLAGEGALLVG